MSQDSGFSHLDAQGRVRMVDVGDKPENRRRAMAQATVRLSPQTYALLQASALPKGDVLTTAQVAGIQAGKQTASLIPMCHPVFVTHLDVHFRLDAEAAQVHVLAEAATTASTGVEMEALVAAQVAALTIYDMCKAVQRDIVITDSRLVYKAGGRSGTYDVREEAQKQEAATDK